MGRRAYDLLRGYVNREWDRIRGVEESDAYKELEAATDTPHRGDIPPASPDSMTAHDPKGFARSVLGVGENATFAEIRRAFERLSRRSDPANFPAGSSEQRQATEILKRVNWAYRILTEDANEVEKRFGSLEIED
jgi:hypothetical protein